MKSELIIKSNIKVARRIIKSLIILIGITCIVFTSHETHGNQLSVIGIILIIPICMFSFLKQIV